FSPGCGSRRGFQLGWPDGTRFSLRTRCRFWGYDRIRRLRRMAGGNRMRCQQRRVLNEHHALQVAKALSGLNSKIVDQFGPDLLKRRKRLGLPAGAIEGRDQVLPQSLAHGVGCDQLAELSNELRSAAESQVRGDAGLRRGESQLVEPGPLALG